MAVVVLPRIAAAWASSASVMLDIASRAFSSDRQAEKVGGDTDAPGTSKLGVFVLVWGSFLLRHSVSVLSDFFSSRLLRTVLFSFSV